jgi:hypothetical protein
MNIIANLYLDLAKSGGPNPLLTGLAAARTLSAAPSFVHGDALTLRLHLCNKGTALNSDATPVPLLEGETLILAAKNPADLHGASLFSATEWTPGPDDSGDPEYYEASLNLNTTQLNTFFTSRTTPLRTLCDIEIQNADNSNRLTWQFTITIQPQRYTGIEGVPVDGDPPYPAPGALELIARKGQPDGYAPLDEDGKVPLENLPEGFGLDSSDSDSGVGVSPASVWRDGSGAPADALGNDGDYYLNNDTGDVYAKQEGIYSVVANIKGPAGANGAAGADGAPGNDGAPGADGAAGAPGSVWRTGSGAPADILGADGDYYLDTATGDVYWRAAGTYTIIANITGPQGPQGDPGISVTFADSEIPTGVVDGVNGTFTLANIPSAGSLHLYLNGLRQKPTLDYTITGNTITFLAGNEPQTGDLLLCDYRY